MNCDERKDQILLYAADALDAGEVEGLRSHLATGCPNCTGALAEAYAVMAHLPLALPSVAPPHAAKAKLLARIDAAGDRRPTRPAVRIFPVVLSSAVAACLAAALVSVTLWLPARNKARLVDASNVQLVALSGATPQPHARGRIFWDRQANDWHVYVFDLKPPATGKTYELWFIRPDQTKIPAGTFDVDPNGSGSLIVKLPTNPDAVALAAITDEPIGGTPQPTGTVQLAGAVK